MIFECFYDWIREMRKTKRDLSYWTEDEENVAEYAWNAGWEESKRFHEAEINALKNRISLLEKEIAFVERGYAKKEELPTMGKLLSFVAGVAIALWIIPESQVDHSAWHIASYKAGRVDALSLNPVSWDLDAACVALWVGQQKLVEAPQ